MVKRWVNTQPDLFEEPPPAIALAPAERAKVLKQLQALLTEAMAFVESESETDDEQDQS